MELHHRAQYVKLILRRRLAQNFLAFFRVAERGLLSWRRTEFATSTLRFRAARVSKRSHFGD